MPEPYPQARQVRPVPQTVIAGSAGRHLAIH